MSQKSALVIAAAVRDNAEWLPAIFRNIGVISDLFSSTKCVFVESDSRDNSLQMLREFQSSREGVEVISLGALQPALPLRTQRIALARNTYLNIVEDRLNDHDLLLVMDTDEVNADPVDVQGVLSNFQYFDWDMICANQKDLYYDLWALRHPEWMPGDCWRQVEDRPSFMSRNAAKKMFVDSKFMHIGKKEPPIPVLSAFGGAAFIKIPSIKGARHEGLKDNRHVCEWVSFCNQLNNGKASILINPAFINQIGRNKHIGLV